VEPRVLDSRRCISYLTIEHRGEFTDAERRMLGDWVFGCDVCQDVCPWNVRFATPTPDPELAPRPELSAPELDALLRSDREEFDRRFGDTPFERPGPDGMLRNAAAVLANRR
jgi:epoxyqueuosine reductase